MLNIIKNTINRVFASGVDSDASAFITATGLSGTTQKSAITTLVKDLKSSGLWSKMKAVYPMVTDNRNQLQYTTTFNSTFYKSDGTATITANYTTAPDGTNTAARMVGNTASSYMYYNINDGLGSGNRTYSIYLKAGTDTNVLLTFNSDGTTVSQSVTLNSSWQRFQLTKNITNSNSGFYITVENVGSGLDLFMWGVQVEFGSTASTYQPILTTPAAFMASQMKYNLKDARDLDAAFRLTWSGGWTYSATGATPNGTNAYADTKLVPSTSLSTSSAHFSKYNRTNDLVGNKVDGSIGGTSTYFMQQNYSAGNAIIGDVASVMSYTPTDTRGLFTATRTSALLGKVFRNSAQVSSSTSTIGGMSDRAMYLGARNDATVTFYNTYQIGFSSIGDGLTDQDSQLLNQIVEKYQVALSRGVQAAQSFYYNSAYSNEANTYLYSTQITGTTQVSAINTLINGLKANNLWAKMKAVYPFVTDYRNLLSYTEDFLDGSWTKGNSTITTNSITAPNGTLTADSLVENTVSSTHLFSNTSGITTSVDNYTLSIYAKKANRDWVYLNLYNGTTSLFAWFNLNTGIVGTIQSGLTASIQDAGSGWYRLSITRTLPSTSNCYIQYGSASADNTTTFIGNGLVAAYFWGAQFEIGTSASVYQPVLGVNNYSTNVAAQMKFNLVNPQDSDAAFRLAFSGGWTYSTNGAQPNGTNGYADTKLIPSAVLSSANSQHYSVYSRTDIAEAKYGYGNDDVRMALKWSDNNIYAKMGTSESGFGANSTSLGLHILNRVNSSNLSVIVRGTKTTLSNSISSLSALSIALGGRQLSGSVDSYGTRQLALATIGDGLSDAEIAILNQLATDYETTLNRNV